VTLARALSVYGEPTIVDTKNVSHDWRKELLTKLAAVQRADGSFVGGKRWMEDNATISTAFAVLAAEDAIKDLREHPAK
jgi:squalene-hopene/tetraprenyl-beta-curcumene cyclase